MKGRLSRLESFFFLRVTFFSVKYRFFNFTTLEKTKKDGVPQNDCEKDAATEPIPGNVNVCFVN